MSLLKENAARLQRPCRNDDVVILYRVSSAPAGAAMLLLPLPGMLSPANFPQPSGLDFGPTLWYPDKMNLAAKILGLDKRTGAARASLLPFVREGIGKALLIVALVLAGMPADGAEVKLEDLLNQAHAAHQKGNSTQAVALASQAVRAAPRNPVCYYVRGRIYADQRETAKAIADFDRLLKLNPNTTNVYQLRGVEHFKLGHFRESIADFDRFIELVPAQKPHHWQRGIALYYAGRYDDGRQQFELHQTVNHNDVENAVWHYLCVARASGVEKARASLIPIEGDSRVPMMKVHQLFAAKASPADVLQAAAGDGISPAAAVSQQMFYAHLYLGLFFEAQGDQKLAREHILKAAQDYKQDHYMGDVARVHAKLLR